MAVCAYLPATRREDTLVALVKEFRAPASTPDGYVWELPGGSSKKPEKNLAQVARDEMREETGLDLPSERFVSVCSRQVTGTLSAHRCHLFMVRLDMGELHQLQGQSVKPLGVAADSERTFVEVRNVSQLLAGDPETDWANLGMLWQALAIAEKDARREPEPNDGS